MSCDGGHLGFPIRIKNSKGHSNDHSFTVWVQSVRPLQTLGFLFQYEIQNGGYGRT
jgi:hypothetical protein